MEMSKRTIPVLAAGLATVWLAGCNGTSNGLADLSPATASACQPSVTGPETASAIWDGLPRTVRADASHCTYFAARRGTCGSYQWIQFDTGGAGDSTLMYFDAAGRVVNTELRFDIERDCADGTKDFVCRSGCEPTVCGGTVSETIAPGSAKAPADCDYSTPSFF
jgi:hypothetical protein